MKFFNFIRNSISAFLYFIGFIVFGILLANPKMPNLDEAGNPIEGTHNTVSFVMILSVFVFTPILVGFLVGYKKSLHLLILISLTVLSIIFFASPDFYEIFGQYLNQILASFFIITLLLVGFQLYQTYNNLVKLDENIKKNWSDIEIAYKKRIDTITELTENSDKYLDHEKSTLVDVIAARKALSGSDLNYTDHKVQLLDNLEKSFGNIVATIEAYPELKGNSIVIHLMNEVSINENILFQKRNIFNESTNKFNNIVRNFPMVFFANSLGFTVKTYFETKMTAIVENI